MKTATPVFPDWLLFWGWRQLFLKKMSLKIPVPAFNVESIGTNLKSKKQKMKKLVGHFFNCLFFSFWSQFNKGFTYVLLNFGDGKETQSLLNNGEQVLWYYFWQVVQDKAKFDLKIVSKLCQDHAQLNHAWS